MIDNALSNNNKLAEPVKIPYIIKKKKKMIKEEYV